MSSVPTEGPCKADCATRVILGFTKGRNNNSFSVFQPSEVLVLWKIQKIFLWKNMGLLVMMYYSSATLKKKGSSKWRSLACWFNHGHRYPLNKKRAVQCLSDHCRLYYYITIWYWTPHSNHSITYNTQLLSLLHSDRPTYLTLIATINYWWG